MKNPCIKCLIYPVCLNSMLQYLKGDVERNPITRESIHRAYNHTIKQKCSLINEYMKELSIAAGDTSIMYHYTTIASALDNIFKLYKRMDAYEKSI